MRILIATVPAAGHFNPLTGAAVRLAQLGHEVRWYAGPDYGARARRLGLEVVPYVEAKEITADTINAVYPERRKLKGRKAIEFDADASSRARRARNSETSARPARGFRSMPF